MMVLQNEERWTTVRIAAALIPPLEELVKNARDEYGIRLFRSKSDAVTKAVREFLRKHQGGNRPNKGGEIVEPR